MAEELCYHEIVLIDNINDQDKVLDTLRTLGTDEDFSGNNGEEYVWEIALENGFDSNQDYVIDELKSSNVVGSDLVKEFFRRWLDSDGYYREWEYKDYKNDNGLYVASVVTTGGY